MAGVQIVFIQFALELVSGAEANFYPSPMGHRARDYGDRWVLQPSQPFKPFQTSACDN